MVIFKSIISNIQPFDCSFRGIFYPETFLLSVIYKINY